MAERYGWGQLRLAVIRELAKYPADYWVAGYTLREELGVTSNLSAIVARSREEIETRKGQGGGLRLTAAGRALARELASG